MALLLIDMILLSAIILVSYLSTFYLVLWLENRKKFFEKPSSAKDLRHLPGLSVIVPAYNEEKTVGKIIKNLLHARYPEGKLEIIVVDDGSDDETYNVAKKLSAAFTWVKVFKKEHSGKGASINYGISKAKNDFVAVVDADSILSRNALINCMKYFDVDVSSVTTRILVKKKETIFEKWQDIEFKLIALTRKTLESINLIFATPGPLSIYRKEVLKEIGMFDEKNLTEDVEIAWRLLNNGYKIRMAYDALVYTYYPENFAKWWKQRVRWSIGGIQTIAKYFNSLFRQHPIGTFLLPISILSTIFSVAGLLIFAYLLMKALSTFVIYLMSSILLSVGPTFDLVIMPDMFIFYGAILFSVTIYFFHITLRQYNSKPKIFTILTFAAFYAFLNLLALIGGANKYLRKEYSWGTR